ncbi:uncharacterized protein LOC124280722 [Haliotis rubra]|uniref:uncharacterized protein LOC124280722 n=1 Tax=Haliotis rubra TaxID=36100 RepID=UPI001EE542F4|nr:uncharacterized protein LOC124280722 [Haliotis rubra]XP_046572661.1 uncharacterized protein LOC124280722 [Haliotis rubra]
MMMTMTMMLSSSSSTSITKSKDNTALGPKTEPSSSKDLTRSLSLTSSFDVSLNLTGPLDLSKHTERDGDDGVDPTTAAATSVKLSDKETLVDLEETDSQQSLTDDLLDSVGGSSLDNSFVGPGSPSVDSNSSNSSVSLPATPPLKWSPQPSTSGVKTNSVVGGPTDLVLPQGKAGSPCIDDLNFLELLRKYDYPSSQSTDNQSCMSIGAPPSPSISVTTQPVGAVPTHIHPNSCDTTLSSSPTSLSASSKQLPCIGTSSMISPTSKSLLRSGTTTCHRYSSSQDPLPKTSSSANTVCQFTDLVHTTLSLNIAPSPTSPVSKVTILPKPTCVSTVQSSAGPSTSRTDLSSNSGLTSDVTTGSNLNSDSSLGSNSVPACGTGIRSGNSQSWTTGTSRLSQLSLPPRKRVRPDTVMLTPTSSSSKSDDACVNCKSILHDLKVSRCTQGHPACSTCLEDQVKLILTDKQGSLKCIMVSCGSYYPMSELKYTLPSMVVEILEDKLHKEHINFVCDMLLPDTGADDQSGTATAAKSGKTGTKADEASAGKKQKFDEDVLSLFEPLKEVQSSPDEDEKLKSPEEDKPQKWDPMDKMVNLAIMALEPESDEYVEVAVNFYSTLAFPSADIVKISRVQNPILWKYYQLKRTEMIHENDGHQVDERQLFHGTNSSVIEAICKKGFDWRVCGKHGSVYGQGSYFAKAASYSHQYTEKVSGHRSRMMAIRTLSALTSSSRTSSSSAVFRQPPGSVLIGPFNQMQVNQLIPHNFLPPSAHMPLGSSLISGIHGQLTPPSTAAPPPPQPQSSSRSNLTVISNIFSGPMPTNNSNPVINSNQNMPVPESNHPSSSAGMTRGFPLTNAGRCSAFNTSNNNTTFPQQANFLRQGSEPSPLRQNNSQKSTKDAKVRVVPMADITSSQTRKMFLAKVLVGKYTGGNTGHRRPPPFYSAEPYGKCYDSCVDNIWDPKIFVIFDSNQAYPEYIVEYNVMNE